MTTEEAWIRVKRLILAFPVLTGDVERQKAISRELERYTNKQVDQAIDEYMRLGEKFLNTSQIVAIAHRIHRQQMERVASEARAMRNGEQVAAHAATEAMLKTADALIAEMSDDEILRESKSIIDLLTGLPREWAEKWTPAQWRGNRRLRLKMARLIQPAG